MSNGSDDDDDKRLLELKSSLSQRISAIHSTGSFATFGTFDNFVHPGISVDPIGIVRLPLSEEDAHALARVSHQTSFSKETETLADESVRKTWEIHADNVRFLNSAWEPSLQSVVKKAASELGVTLHSVRAEFCKMLIYEEGATFKAHKDTEKVQGMFGTLTICLPSEHIGGAVCLQHGTKSQTFETSSSSAFGTTYIAWYADVTHEIKLIESGYRWALIYNLINDSEIPDQSASAFDANIKDFTQLLTQWQGFKNSPKFLAYGLKYKYTTSEPRAACLKGDDYHSVRFVAESCAEHGEFLVLLANVELCRTYADSTSEMSDIDSELYFQCIANLEGFNLTAYERLYFEQSDFLHTTLYSRTEPDDQVEDLSRGETEFFYESAMILVPKQFISLFLLDVDGPNGVKLLLKRLKEGIEDYKDNLALQELPLQICQRFISMEYAACELKDSHLSHIAVAAISMRSASLFTQAVEKITMDYDNSIYSELGEVIDLQNLCVSEDDIVKILTKSKCLHKIHENLVEFCIGFTRGNINRRDPVEKRYLKRWVDKVLFKTLSDLSVLQEEDARTLVKIILDRHDDRFRQFVLYQGVRSIVERFLGKEFLEMPLMVELLVNLQEKGNSHNLLENLFARVLESAISSFDLKKYDAYIKFWYKKNQSLRAGLIKALCERSCAHDRDYGTRLFIKIQKQTSQLEKEQLDIFMPPVIEGLLPVVDTSFSNIKALFRSFISAHITQFVGNEPEKPIDWSWPEEAKFRCYHIGDGTNCINCLKMIEFLENPELKAIELSVNVTQYSYRGLELDGYIKINNDYSKMVSVVTKLLEWFESKHKAWEDRASIIQEFLRKLPQDKLKECLAHRYDEFMDLRLLKINHGSIGSGSTGGAPGHFQTTSLVPQKRSVDDLEAEAEGNH